MGAAFHYKEVRHEDGDIDCNKASQTDVVLPVNETTVVYESRINDGSTQDVLSTYNNVVEERDHKLEALRREVEFLKDELNIKQNNIENLLQLLKLNLDIVKEISHGVTSSSFEMSDSLDTSFPSSFVGNSPSTNNQKLSAELREHYTTLQRRMFEESLHYSLASRATRTYDVFVDSLDE